VQGAVVKGQVKQEVTRQARRLLSAACRSALVLACAAGATPGAQAATLDEWVRKALARDSQVRAARQDVEAARARMDQANATLLPQVNFTANTNRTQQHLNYEGDVLPDRRDRFSTYGYNLQLTQALYRRDDMARREAARMALDQTDAQARFAEQAMRVRVVQPWYEACQYTHLAQAAALDVSRQRTRGDALDKRLAQGDLAAHEASLAQADLALALAKLLEAESERSQRLFALAELGGAPLALAELSCELKDAEDAVPELDVWLQDTRDQSPELEAAHMAVKVAQAQLQQASGAQGPSLDFVATNSVSRQGPSASLNVGSEARSEAFGLQLTVPIFAGGALNAKEREALAQLGKVEADLDTLLLRLRQDVSSNWHSLQIAKAHGLAAAQRVQALQAQQAAIERRVAQGQAVDADAQQAQQELAAAQAERVRLQGLVMLARVKLTAQAGLPWQDARPPTTKP
jgi:outer membrane protein